MQCPPTPQGDAPIHGLPPPRNNQPPNPYLQPGPLIRPVNVFHEALSLANREYNHVITALNNALDVQANLEATNKRFADAEAGWLSQQNALREESGRLETAKKALETELKDENQTLGAQNLVLGAEILTLKEDLQEVRSLLTTREGEIGAVRAVRETCEQTVRDLTARLETKDRRLEAALTFQSTSEQTMKDLRGQLEIKQGDLDTALAINKSSEQTTNDLRDRLKTSRSDLEATLREQKDSEHTAQCLGNQLQKTNDALTTALAAYEEAEQGMQGIREELKKSQQDADQVRQTVKRMDTDLQSYETKLVVASQAADSLRKNYAAAVQKIEEEKRTALATLRDDLDEQMEQLESGRRQEMREKQTIQRQLVTERWCRKQNNKKLRTLRATLAEMEAIDRAASLCKELKRLAALECDDDIRNFLVCESYVLDVVYKRSQSKQKLDMVQVGRDLAHSLTRSQVQQERRREMQNLHERNQDLETELRVVSTKAEARRIKIGRLERGMVAIMDDGEEKERVDAAMKALDHALSREECIKLFVAMANESTLRHNADRPVVASSSKRSADDAPLDKQVQPVAKKAKIDSSLCSVISRTPGDETFTAGVVEVIALSASNDVSVHGSSSQEQEDALPGAADDSRPHTMSNEYDRKGMVEGSRQPPEQAEAQDQVPDEAAGLTASELNHARESTTLNHVDSLPTIHHPNHVQEVSSSANDQSLACADIASIPSCSDITADSRHSKSPKCSLYTAPSSSPATSRSPPPPPSSTSPVAATSPSPASLPPPEYGTPPLPPPPEEIPSWAQKRVSFSDPLILVDNSTATKSHEPQIPSTNQPCVTQPRKPSPSSQEEAVGQPKEASIKFALPTPLPSTKSRSAAQTPSRAEPRRTPIQPLKDRERQQKRLAQNSGALTRERNDHDPSTKPASFSQTSHQPYPTNPSDPSHNSPSPTTLYARREPSSHPQTTGPDDSDEGRRAHRQRGLREQQQQEREKGRRRQHERQRQQSRLGFRRVPGFGRGRG